MARTSGSEDGAAVADKPEVEANERESVMFTMPKELKDKIEEDANGRGIAVAAVVRQIVADFYSYTLPDIQRGGARRKYQTDEEREAAKKVKAERRKTLVNSLLKLYKNKDLPPDLLAAIESQLEDSGEDDEEEEEDSE